MTIALNNDFEISRDNHGWQLHALTRKSDEKSGEEKVSRKTTFYPNLRQCCNAASERIMGKCQSIEEIVAALDKFEQAICQVFGDLPEAAQEKNKNARNDNKPQTNVSSHQAKPEKAASCGGSSRPVSEPVGDGADLYQEGLAAAIGQESAHG